MTGLATKGKLIGPPAAALLIAAALTLWALSGGGHGASANPGLTIGVDTNPSGNTKTSLGVINPCRDITAGQQFQIDFYITDVTPNLIAFDTVLEFNPAFISVVSVDVQQILSALAGSAVTNGSTSAGAGLHRAAAVDTNNFAAESGSGVLARFTLQALANGVSVANLVRLVDFSTPVLTDASVPAGHPGDTNGDGVYDGTIANGTIAIGQPDSNGNGISDVCDPDQDGDGVLNANDNCPSVPNPTQADLDGDGLGDACDGDIDGDGFLNTTETDKGSNPANALSLVEVCDNADNDGDTLVDEGYNVIGSATADCNEAVDTDGDTTPNTSDPDDDNDGFSDAVEAYIGTDSLDNCSDTIRNPWGAPKDDALGPDFDQNNTVNVIDVILYKPVILTTLGVSPKYNRRMDLNASGTINVLDVILIKPHILKSCSPDTLP